MKTGVHRKRRVSLVDAKTNRLTDFHDEQNQASVTSEWHLFYQQQNDEPYL